MSKTMIDNTLIDILKTNFRNSSYVDKLAEENVKLINWMTLIEEKSVCKLLPLVYFTLKKNNLLEYISKDVLERLKNYYLFLIKQNLLLFNELSIVLSELAKTNLEVLVFKGAALAEKVYPNIGLRPMSDVDLLLKSKDDMKKVTDILQSLGFESLDQERKDAFVDAIIYETTFVKETHPKCTIDVHITIPYLGLKKDAQGFSNTERIWQNARLDKINNQKVWLMSAEDAIPNLIGHELVQHKEDRMLFYCDLGFIIKENSIDWNKIITPLEGSPITPHVLHALEKAKNEFEIPVPNEVIDELIKMSDNTGLFRNILISDSKLIHLNFFDKLVEAKTVTKKIGLISRYIFPSLGYMRQAYGIKNNWSLVLQYFNRPIRITIRSTQLILRSLFNRS